MIKGTKYVFKILYLLMNACKYFSRTVAVFQEELTPKRFTLCKYLLLYSYEKYIHYGLSELKVKYFERECKH